MSAHVVQTGPVLRRIIDDTGIRGRAVADANQLRALACAALRDGAPHGARRAATARASARAVLAHAKRLSAIIAKSDRHWTRGLQRYAVADVAPAAHLSGTDQPDADQARFHLPDAHLPDAHPREAGLAALAR